MTAETKNMIGDLVRDIQLLNIGNFEGADLLYQRTKLYATRYFGLKYSVDLVGIRFKAYTSIEDIREVFTDGKTTLLKTVLFYGSPSA